MSEEHRCGPFKWVYGVADPPDYGPIAKLVCSSCGWWAGAKTWDTTAVGRVVDLSNAKVKP